MNDYDKNWCPKILNDLSKLYIIKPFCKAVDVKQSRDYLRIVSTPMDLSKIKNKHNNGEYKFVDDFIKDIKLMCSNAQIYNGERSVYTLMSKDIEKYVDSQLASKKSNIDEEWICCILTTLNKLNQHIEKGKKIFLEVE